MTYSSEISEELITCEMCGDWLPFANALIHLREVHSIIDPMITPWRTGRKLGRTIYLMVGNEPFR